MRNIDDLIHGMTPPPPTDEKRNEPTKREVEPEEAEEIQDDREEDTETREDGESEPQSKEATEQDSSESSDKRNDYELDEYGNQIPKARMYTEEEVNKIMRDRFSRGSFANNPQQQSQVQEAAKNFEPDPNSAESWEDQLKGFVKETINDINKETENKQWQERENQKQAEFEGKFTTGMQRYKDFHQVVNQVPLSDAMVMAVRDMEDPAAFMYAAAKTQSAELNRIRALTDPFAQAVQLGKLDEKMKKVRTLSKTAQPLQPTKGDVSSKDRPRQSIDDKIHQHARSRTRR